MQSVLLVILESFALFLHGLHSHLLISCVSRIAIYFPRSRASKERCFASSWWTSSCLVVSKTAKLLWTIVDSNDNRLILILGWPSSIDHSSTWLLSDVDWNVVQTCERKLSRIIQYGATERGLTRLYACFRITIVETGLLSLSLWSQCCLVKIMRLIKPLPFYAILIIVFIWNLQPWTGSV